VDFVLYTLTVKKKIRAGFDMSDRTIPLLELHNARGRKSNDSEKVTKGRGCGLFQGTIPASI
jgi:hypothetical protein